MAKAKSRVAKEGEPIERLIHALMGPYRGQIVYAGEDYDQSIAEGWAIPAHSAQPTDEIPDLDAKIELANAMAQKWQESGGPVIVPVEPVEPAAPPVLTGLTPDTAVAGDADLPAVEATGTDFTASTVILLDGAAAATTFVSPTSVTFPLAVSGETVARTIAVTIQGGTGSASFDITEPAARSTKRR
jgi:hypothetical protein